MSPAGPGPRMPGSGLTSSATGQAALLGPGPLASVLPADSEAVAAPPGPPVPPAFSRDGRAFGPALVFGPLIPGLRPDMAGLRPVILPFVEETT